MPRKSKTPKPIVTEEPAPITEVLVKTTAEETRLKPVSQPSDNPFEDRRKEMQRKIQKMVTEMRAEDRSDADIKYAVTREKRKEERKVIALEEKRANEQKACSNDVIIIPVAWKRNHNEKISVDVTCDNVRRALFSAGLSPWLDCRREYSPGQKFAYWEHMGVKHRIEIGPEDISTGVCRVVRSDTPGAYLEHRREQPELNLQSIIRTLADFGLEKCKTMNTDLMSSDSLIEWGSVGNSNEGVFDNDEVGGNAVVPDHKNTMKKFRRF
jgi:hypothetical protein